MPNPSPETYVDDILAGAHALEDAESVQIHLIVSLQSTGRLLKKYTANHKKLLENIVIADRLDTEFLKVHETKATNTLGIKWDARNDLFHHNIKDFLTHHKKHTVRHYTFGLVTPSRPRNPIN